MSDNTIILPILGMTCANCSAAVERSIRREPGVTSVTVNLSTEKATVEIDPQTWTNRLIDRVRRAGYDVAIGEAVAFHHAPWQQISSSASIVDV